MKKLTEEEVETLFPKKTFHDWLNGGRERDHQHRDGMLHEENETFHPDLNVVHLSENQDNELTRVETAARSVCSHDLTDEAGPSSVAKEDAAIELHDLPSLLDDPKEIETESELHFSSGSCAICLEVIEDEDIVRGLICGHVFHADCLDPWLTKRRACCPMCKRDYFSKTITTPTNAEATELGSAAPAPDLTSGAEVTTEAATTAEGGAEGEADADADNDLVLDIEMLRNDPVFIAMLLELAPMEERVHLLLQEQANIEDNIEEEAKRLTAKKYGLFFKIIWWKLMGISKKDLFNWMVLKLVRERQAERDATRAQNEPEEAQPTAAETTDATETTGTPEETQPAETSLTVADISEARSPEISPTITPDPESSRAVVEQRV